MADRVVSVSIRAEVSNFLAGSAKVQQAAEKTATAAQNIEKQHQAFEKVGAGITTIGVAAAAAVAIAVKSFADFDAQMSQVQSLSHATASEMDKLRNAALTMGQGIGFSATEVADAETELVKAGISVKDILGGGLKGALDLAAAGQIEVGRATEIAASAMTQFGLKGKDVPHIADLLAAGADKALGGVEQLGQALQQSGLVANQFGLSIDDTVGTLAEFAQNGLMGSDAGTSLKQMFLQLATPTKQAQLAMEKYHISAYNAQGDFVGITSLAGQLAAGFKGVDDASRDSALGIIFGSDAIRAANILMNDGADKNRKWINSVNAAGFAAAQAAGKTDNLNGDIKKLGAAFESGLIKSGSASNDVLRSVTQNMTGFVQAIGDAPPALLGVGLGLTALVGATALAGGGFLQLVPKIAAAKAAMKDLQISGGTLAKGFGAGTAITLGLASIASGIANVGSEAELTQGQIKKLNAAVTSSKPKTLDQQFSGGNPYMFSLDAITTKVSTAKQALDSLDANKANIAVGKFLDGASFGVSHLSDTAKRFEAQFKQMGSTLATTAESDVAGAAAGFNKLVDGMGGGQETARQLLDRMGPYKDQLEALAGAQGKTLSSTELLNLAQGKGKLAAQLAAESTSAQNKQLAELSGVASQADEDISKLADQIRGFGSTQLDANSAARDLEQAIDDQVTKLKAQKDAYQEAHGSLDGFKTSLDISTESGRENAAALDEIAQKGIAAAAAIAANGGTQEEATKKVSDARQAYIDAAGSLGIGAEQAGKMADQLKLIPGNVSTLFQVQGADEVTQKTEKIKGGVNAIPKSKVTALKGDIADAQKKLADLEGKLSKVPKSKSTALRAEIQDAKTKLAQLQTQLNNLNSKTITVTTVTNNVVADGSPGKGAGVMLNKAGGGYISGPGTATSDSIPAMLSDGEYVIRAAAVQKYGRHTFDRMNAAKYANGGLVQKFANGGGVEYQYSKFAGNFAGMQGVSQLMSIFGDSSYRASYRNEAGLAALRFQRSLTSLTDKSDKAAQKLGDLRSSADSLKSSVANAVGSFDVGNFRSASTLSRGLSKSAGQVKEFAGLLTTLSKKGINADLLAEIASLGTAEGLPLARSLAAASATDIKSINSSYSSIKSTAGKAGQTVSDANYKALIASADKNARSLEGQIAKQSVAIQKIIARGFGVKGYAAGGFTGAYGLNEVAGVVHGREYVVNAAATAKNRALLEHLNSGRPIRYMTPNPTASVRQGPQQVVHRAGNNYNLSVQDPTAVAQAIERRERAEYV